MSADDSITAVVLAGGQARRMGGQDKGLLTVLGKPMVLHIIEQLSPRVGRILINANRNAESYARFGLPVIADRIDGYAGPLAGMAAAMERCTTDLLLTVPCDGPRLPEGLSERLLLGLRNGNAEIAVAHDGKRMQPVYALLSCRLRSSLDAYLMAGDRKIDLWYAQHRLVAVDFSDQSEAFVNINSPEELAAAEAHFASPNSEKEAP